MRMAKNKSKTDSKIIERIYISGDFKTESPCLVGSGEDKNTDMDFIRDWEEKPFLPATSIAGAILGHLVPLEALPKYKDLIKELFGREQEEEHAATQSLICFYDAKPRETANLNFQIRDGVALHTYTKTAKDSAKYTYEVIEAGNIFSFRMEVLFREKHRKQKQGLKALLHFILRELQEGNIFIGRKSKRGLGKVKLEKMKILELDISKPDHQNQWIEFNWEDLNAECDWESWKDEDLSATNRWTTISSKFHLPYSLMIRYYNIDPDFPDTVHLMSNGRAVIPASSWSGLLRHTGEKLGRELGKTERIKKLVQDLFGYTELYLFSIDSLLEEDLNGQEISDAIKIQFKEKGHNLSENAKIQKKTEEEWDIRDSQNCFTLKKEDFEINVYRKTKDSKSSRVRIAESTIQKPLMFDYTRNKINRFTGGTVDTALFDERAVYNKKATTVSLSMSIENIEPYEKDFLLLILKEIGNGLAPIGGETSIGRGILEIYEVKIIEKISKTKLNQMTFLDLANYLNSSKMERVDE